jgi:hypothetical protein
VLLNLFHTIEKEATLSNLFYEVSIVTIPKPGKETKKLLTNFLGEHRCKIPLQNTANPIQQFIRKIVHHDQVGFIPAIQKWFKVPNE